jgi:tellurite resistance protein TerC
VYTSNVFAILGLRSLYFLLAKMMDKFHRLKTGLAFILAFVGVKMCIAEWIKIPIHYSLLVIAAVLVGSVVASLAWPAEHGQES